MEFERAIYRVYERCLDGLRDEENAHEAEDRHLPTPKSSCKVFELVVGILGAFFTINLFLLHNTFVGRTTCLPSLLEDTPFYNATTHTFQMHNDYILQIDVTKRLAPAVDPYVSREINDDLDDGPVGAVSQGVVVDNSIFHRSWSSFKEGAQSFLASNGLSFIKASDWTADSIDLHPLSSYAYSYFSTRTSLDTSSSAGSAALDSHSNTSRHTPSRFYLRDYEFAYDVGALFLSPHMRKVHNFITVNVTMTGEECFGKGYAEAIVPLGGADTIIRNNLVFTFRHGGHLITAAGDYYSWITPDGYKEKQINTILGWIITRLSVLGSSVFSFYVLSTCTALLIRVLISSGVVLLFPVFWFMQNVGVNVITSRILSLSYPWIGVPLEILRNRNQPTIPFLIGHFTRVVMYYMLYEAVQVTFGIWFYGDSRPGAKELWLFAAMLLLEYYSMIYVRAKASIVVFPRITFALYLVYNFYVYLSPNGFHLLALLASFTINLSLMAFCVNKFEMEEFRSGTVNIDQPRGYQTSVPWSIWGYALPPDFTLFMPLTEVSRSVYNMAPPDIGAAPQGNNNNDNNSSSINPIINGNSSSSHGADHSAGTTRGGYASLQTESEHGDGGISMTSFSGTSRSNAPILGNTTNRSDVSSSNRGVASSEGSDMNSWSGTSVKDDIDDDGSEEDGDEFVSFLNSSDNKKYNHKDDNQGFPSFWKAVTSESVH